MSEYLKTIYDEFQTFEITRIICNNKKIFSFNNTNISIWKKRLEEHDLTKQPLKKKQKLSSKNSQPIISKDRIMKFIVKTRKLELHRKITKIFEKISTPKEFTINEMVQRILKYEFLGLIELTRQDSPNYTLFGYYFGNDNSFESISNYENWKILNTVGLDEFHFILKNDWKNYIGKDETTGILTESSIFELIPKENDLFTLEFPGYVPFNPDIDHIFPIYDPRFIAKKFVASQNKYSIKQSSKKKESLSSPTTIPQKKETLKRKRVNNKKDEKQKKSNDKKLSIDDNDLDCDGFSNTIPLTTSNALITPEDFLNRNCIIPPNLKFNSNDYVTLFEQIISKKSNPPKKVSNEYSPAMLAQIILLSLNPYGVIHKTIQSLSINNALTRKNQNTDLENEIISNEDYHEKIRESIFEYINSLIIVNMLTK